LQRVKRPEPEADRVYVSFNRINRLEIGYPSSVFHGITLRVFPLISECLGTNGGVTPQMPRAMHWKNLPGLYKRINNFVEIIEFQ
jgi:hypothetical protein